MSQKKPAHVTYSYWDLQPAFHEFRRPQLFHPQNRNNYDGLCWRRKEIIALEKLKYSNKFPLQHVKMLKRQRTKNLRVLVSGKEQFTYFYFKYTLEELVTHFRKLHAYKCSLFSGVPMMVLFPQFSVVWNWI